MPVQTLNIQTLREFAEDLTGTDKKVVLDAIREIEYLRDQDSESTGKIEHFKRVIMDQNRKLENIGRAWELCGRYPDTAEEITRLEAAISDRVE